MHTFDLFLYSSEQHEEVNGLISLVAKDNSGSFNLQAYQAKLMSYLEPSVGWYRLQNGAIEYLVVDGGILHFANNQLIICTRQYFRHQDLAAIQKLLEAKLEQERKLLEEIQALLRDLKQQLFNHLLKLKCSD